jgi:hypothetical protein
MIIIDNVMASTGSVNPSKRGLDWSIENITFHSWLRKVSLFDVLPSWPFVIFHVLLLVIFCLTLLMFCLLVTVDKAIKAFTDELSEDVIEIDAAWLDAELKAASLEQHVAAAHASAGLCEDEEVALSAFVEGAGLSEEEEAMEAFLADEGDAVITAERRAAFRREYARRKAEGRCAYCSHRLPAGCLTATCPLCLRRLNDRYHDLLRE